MVPFSRSTLDYIQDDAEKAEEVVGVLMLWQAEIEAPLGNE